MEILEGSKYKNVNSPKLTYWCKAIPIKILADFSGNYHTDSKMCVSMQRAKKSQS